MPWQHEQCLDLTHVVQLENLWRQNPQQRQRELVEEAPAKLIKVVEEVVHLGCWNHLGEESEVPICCKDLNVHSNLLQMLV